MAACLKKKEQLSYVIARLIQNNVLTIVPVLLTLPALDSPFGWTISRRVDLRKGTRVAGPLIGNSRACCC